MRVRPSLAVLPAYLALTVALTWPLARELRHAVPADHGPTDALMQAFIVGWDLQRLASEPGRLFDAPSFHPERRTLTYMDHLVGEALLAAPGVAVGGTLATGYNRVVVLSFVASAWLVYRLLRAAGISRAASFLGGFLYTFSSYRLSNLANLNQLTTQLVPLGLFFALRFLTRRRARDVALALLVVGLQTWFGWYYTYHLAIGLLVVLAFAVATGRARPFPLRAALLAALAALLLALPVAWPYLEQRRAMPGYVRTLGYTALYSADLLDWGRTHYESRLAALMPWRAGGQAYWPGLVTVVLGVAGWRAWRRHRRAGRVSPFAGAFAALAATGFVLSLGPVLQVAGQRLWVPLPYIAAYYLIPGFPSMRAPGRFAQLALLGGVALAAIGFDAWRRRRRPNGAAVGMRPAAAPLAAGLLIAAAETFSVPIALVEVPGPASLPAAHRWLAAQPGPGAILELPMPASAGEENVRDAVRQLWSLYHRRPRADGVSGFSPPAHERFRATMQAFPDDSAVAAARARGVRWVVVRGAELDAEARRRIARGAEAGAALRRVAAFGSDLVYALDAAER